MCLLCYRAQSFNLVGCRSKRYIIIINNQSIDLIKPYFFKLSFGFRNIKCDGEGSSLPLLTFAFYSSAHQINHFLSNCKPQAGSLNTVDTAVCLTRERLIHRLYEFRTHSDACIRHNVDHLYAAGNGTCFLTHIYTDSSTRFRIFDGIGEYIDIYLIQAKLIRIQVFLFHMINMKIELNILFLNHRLRYIYKVFNSLNNGECHGAQFQFTAFYLGNIQNIINQSQQMIAGKADLPKVFSG